MLEQEVCSSLILLSPKMNGMLRFWVDYRKLNAVAVHESYPILRTEHSIDSMGKATNLWILEANSGYRKVEIAEGDRAKTAFASHHGLFQFIIVFIGLESAPSTFWRAMDVILSLFHWQFALVYFYDIVIF